MLIWQSAIYTLVHVCSIKCCLEVTKIHHITVIYISFCLAVNTTTCDEMFIYWETRKQMFNLTLIYIVFASNSPPTFIIQCYFCCLLLNVFHFYFVFWISVLYYSICPHKVLYLLNVQLLLIFLILFVWVWH